MHDTNDPIHETSCLTRHVSDTRNGKFKYDESWKEQDRVLITQRGQRWFGHLTNELAICPRSCRRMGYKTCGRQRSRWSDNLINTLQ